MHISNKELFTGIMGEKNVRAHDDGKMDNIEIHPRTVSQIPKLRYGRRSEHGNLSESYAAQMLGAYYDKTCDSHELFAGFRIAQDQTYEKHIGKYDVIYLDMTNLLGKTKAEQLAGESIVVDTDSFQNDAETFTCKDDVLTLLIHLGYLTYEEVLDSYDEDDDQYTGLARIPNEEVRSEFEKILRKAKHRSLIRLVKRSDQLLQDTISMNIDAVAKAIQDVHESEYAPTWYNNEHSLRYVVKMAYISSVDQYGKVEELPTGHSIADIVFVPKRRSTLPAMIVELKWDKSAEGAIKQIKGSTYPKGKPEGECSMYWHKPERTGLKGR